MKGNPKFVIDVDRYVKYVDNGMRPDYTIETAAIGLGGETGEVLNAIKKLLVYKKGEPATEQFDKYEFQAKEELGDVFWQWVALCRKLGYNVHEVVELNVDKLQQKYNDVY